MIDLFGFDKPVDMSQPCTSLPIAKSPHAIATHHSAQAAQAATPGRATKSAQYLELLAKAGDAGLTDWEVVQAMAIPLSSVCSIRNGVRVFVWPAERVALSPFNRNVTAWRRATEDEMQTNRMAQP